MNDRQKRIRRNRERERTDGLDPNDAAAIWLRKNDSEQKPAPEECAPRAGAPEEDRGASVDAGAPDGQPTRRGRALAQSKPLELGHRHVWASIVVDGELHHYVCLYCPARRLATDVLENETGDIAA